MSLHSAAFPGRYGRFAGAIVAGKTREAPNDLRAEGNLRLFDAGAFAETPLDASAQTEIVSRSCDQNGGCVPHELGPVVAPSIGVEGSL